MSGFSSKIPESCSNCFWWRIPRPRTRKTCKRDRVVRIGKHRVTGTPHDYWCAEYAPKDFATCGECVFWKDRNRPFHTSPCSKLSLQDRQGRARTEDSVFCRRFDQKIGFVIHNNQNLRIDGVLVEVLDLVKHSEPVTLLIRQSPTSGIVLAWTPHGPGKGAWEIASVSLDGVDIGSLSLEQVIDPRTLRQEVRFAGKIEILWADGSRKVLAGQRIEDARLTGISRIRLYMEREAPRTFDGNGVTADGGTPLVQNLQDEPWGDSWEDLKEQCRMLMTTGTLIGDAATKVAAEFFRERKTGCSQADAKRLSTQLEIAFGFEV